MSQGLSTPQLIRRLLLLVVAMFAFGFMTTMQNICIWAYRHETTPAPLIGRVSGMTGAIFKIGVPLALLGAGVLADVAGARMVFMVCGVVQALVFLVFMRSRLMCELTVCS